jgi:hypothetical protein
MADTALSCFMLSVSALYYNVTRGGVYVVTAARLWAQPADNSTLTDSERFNHILFSDFGDKAA